MEGLLSKSHARRGGRPDCWAGGRSLSTEGRSTGRTRPKPGAAVVRMSGRALALKARILTRCGACRADFGGEAGCRGSRPGPAPSSAGPARDPSKRLRRKCSSRQTLRRKHRFRSNSLSLERPFPAKNSRRPLLWTPGRWSTAPVRRRIDGRDSPETPELGRRPSGRPRGRRSGQWGGRSGGRRDLRSDDRTVGRAVGRAGRRSGGGAVGRSGGWTVGQSDGPLGGRAGGLPRGRTAGRRTGGGSGDLDIIAFGAFYVAMLLRKRSRQGRQVVVVKTVRQQRPLSSRPLS